MSRQKRLDHLEKEIVKVRAAIKQLEEDNWINPAHQAIKLRWLREDLAKIQEEQIELNAGES